MSPELKVNIVQLILIPCFAASFEKGENTKLIGTQDSPDDIVSVFTTKIIEPENPLTSIDCVRIALLQLSCLFVEQASQFIDDGSNEQQSDKLIRLISFAWPCLLNKNCVDPLARYHGYLLLSHVIAKFALDDKIVLQVFRDLLKAHAVEARPVVRQALDIITPAMTVRMKDGFKILTHWTKKIIVEEGYSMQQLFHILQLVVRHYKVYYPVRHHLVQHMVNSIQRLGFNLTATIDHRRLAVDLAEVIVKWELHLKGLEKIIEEPETKRMAALTAEAVSSSSVVPKASEPIDKAHSDAIINFLLKLSCRKNNFSSVQPDQEEELTKRCMTLLKMALEPDVWSQSCDLELSWMDKVLLNVETNQPDYGNICTALELLTFLLGVIEKEQMLVSLRPLQRSLGACIASTDEKVIRAAHALLTQMMSVFPTDPQDRTVSSEDEKLETLYDTVGKFITDGLSAYEKNKSAPPNTLFGPVMMLDAACTNHQSYIDSTMSAFMSALQRMVEHHLHAQPTESNQMGSELLITSLNLVENRVAVMNDEVRKLFIGAILIGLIDGTHDVKVMKEINRFLEEWMRNDNSALTNQAPSLGEKTILLVKMMHNVEKRFPDDLELNGQFLELVNYVYREETLKSSELTSKLEPAFLSGLRCVQPHIRAKFFEVFDGSMRRRLHERLLYIICSQSWDAMGPHYWIKQCIELLIVTANSTTQLQLSNQDTLLPSIKSLMQQVGNEEPLELMEIDEINEDMMDVYYSHIDPDTKSMEVTDIKRQTTFAQMIANQAEFLDSCKNVKTEQLLIAAAQLCHMDTSLAERVWLDTFPRLWSILDEHQQTTLIAEIVPFVCSGTHVIQKDCHPSAIATFVEALSHCNPPVHMSPAVMEYLGSSL